MEKKCLSEHNQQHILFCKIIYNAKFIVQSILDPDINFC